MSAPLVVWNYSSVNLSVQGTVVEAEGAATGEGGGGTSSKSMVGVGASDASQKARSSPRSAAMAVHWVIKHTAPAFPSPQPLIPFCMHTSHGSRGRAA
jgi:predicted metal-binding membrane protein